MVENNVLDTRRKWPRPRRDVGASQNWNQIPDDDDDAADDD